MTTERPAAASSDFLRRVSPAAPPRAAACGAERSRASGRTARLIAAGLALLLAAEPVAPALAQQAVPGSIPLVRDAETETLLRDYAAPIFKAANVPSRGVEIILINEREYNAFVVDGTRMFMNVGVLIDAATPNEVIGVIAHETGHIAGSHMVRLREAMARAQTLAVIGAVLGAGAIAASAATRSRSGMDGGAAVFAGTAQIAQRSLLAYARTEEMSADRAAITYLEKTGQSGRGMLTTFKRFADQLLVKAASLDKYALTHPMPQERIAQLERLIETSKFADRKDPPELQARHDLMRAKLSAFTGNLRLIERLYPATDNGLPARYARAVLAYRFKNPADAIRQLDELIKVQPNNPYFWELRGQVLLEWGKPREALAPLRKAVSLAPNAGPIRSLLGQALVATEDKALTDEAIRELQSAVDRDKLDSGSYRFLARAYAMKGDLPKADLMIAKGLFVAGDIQEARRYANRAQGNLKPGSPDWLRADDIVSYKPNTP